MMVSFLFAPRGDSTAAIVKRRQQGGATVSAPRLITAVGLCAGAFVGAMSASAQGESSPAPVPIWSVAGSAWGVPVADSSTTFALSKQHEVVAIDADTGRVRWRHRTAIRDDLTSGRRVLLAGPVVVAGDYDIYGLNRGDGTLRWRFSPVDGGYAPGLYLGVTAGGLVFAGSPAGRLYAVRADSGEPVWSALLGSTVPTTVFEPIEADGVVFAGFTVFGTPHTGGVVAVDVATGLELWRTVFSDALDNTSTGGWAGGPVVAGDLVVSADSRGRITAMERDGGRVRWTIDKKGTSVPLPERDFRPLAAADDLVVAGSLSGYVVAYDVTSRRERWHFSGTAHGSVGLAFGQDAQSIYIPYMSGRLVALDTSTGRERWVTDPAVGRIFWPPALFGRRLYVTTETSVAALQGESR